MTRRSRVGYLFVNKASAEFDYYNTSESKRTRDNIFVLIEELRRESQSSHEAESCVEVSDSHMHASFLTSPTIQLQVALKAASSWYEALTGAPPPPPDEPDEEETQLPDNAATEPSAAPLAVDVAAVSVEPTVPVRAKQAAKKAKAAPKAKKGTTGKLKAAGVSGPEALQSLLQVIQKGQPPPAPADQAKVQAMGELKVGMVCSVWEDNENWHGRVVGPLYHAKAARW